MNARHGANVPRGLGAPDAGQAGRGRFGRMFPCLPVRALSAEAVRKLIRFLNRHEIPENAAIPAGYTYVGQFIDHDLTFDPTSLQQKDVDPLARVNFRTPRLDLDSLYGSGPADQPYLYESNGEARDRGVKLLTTSKPSGDLPRNSEGRALTGDPRNDENLILAQLHLLFIRFHNAVVEHLRKQGTSLTGDALFLEARRTVQWHYQWMIVDDFLPKVAGQDTMAQVLGTGDQERPHRWFCGHDGAFIPLEFSGAAYRFGHSMVRPTYTMNEDEIEVPILPLASDPTRSLRGFRHLPKEFVIDWPLFFELGGSDVQASMAIDTVISQRLLHLPADVGTDGEPSLPRLNLMRAAQLRLPAGPDVARAMGFEPLTAEQLLPDDIPVSPEIADELLHGAPLWYYVLAEAAALRGGTCLGPVGGRIVAEVLVGLIEGDPSSYLNAPAPWTPTLGREGRFAMADLVRFTEGGVGDDRA